MILDSLIQFDQQLLLTLNSFHCPAMDVIMWYVTKTLTWLPYEAGLLWLLWRQLKDWRLLLLALAGVALVVLCADQFSSGLCKNYFCRLRPTHDPLIGNLVHTLHDYRGGLYGFISSHAANTFGVATFLSFVFRKRAIIAVLFLWAVICSYSRIYLGVHYPGDIICGAIAGCIIAYIIFLIHEKIKPHFRNGRISC